MSKVAIVPDIWDAPKSEARSSAIVPRGRVVTAMFNIIVPNAATREDIEDWLSMHMGCGGMATDNPLAHHEPEAASAIWLTDTGRQTNMLEKREEALRRVVEKAMSVPAETAPSGAQRSELTRSAQDEPISTPPPPTDGEKP